MKCLAKGQQGKFRKLLHPVSVFQLGNISVLLQPNSQALLLTPRRWISGRKQYHNTIQTEEWNMICKKEPIYLYMQQLLQLCMQKEFATGFLFIRIYLKSQYILECINQWTNPCKSGTGYSSCTALGDGTGSSASH